jgi:hypothetical protein
LIEKKKGNRLIKWKIKRRFTNNETKKITYKWKLIVLGRNGWNKSIFIDGRFESHESLMNLCWFSRDLIL